MGKKPSMSEHAIKYRKEMQEHKIALKDLRKLIKKRKMMIKQTKLQYKINEM